MPTLGEFIERACRPPYQFTKQTIRVPGPGQRSRLRFVYLRRQRQGRAEELIDLPSGPETQRLNRSTLESLCPRTGALLEDFGINPSQ